MPHEAPGDKGDSLEDALRERSMVERENRAKLRTAALRVMLLMWEEQK